MSFKLQPGTIQYRAIAWLKSMAKVRPSYEPSTVELCAALDIETDGFTAFMSTCRYHGLVTARKKTGQGKILFWSLGDGKPVEDIRAGYEVDEPLHAPVVLDLAGVRAPLFPQARPQPPFRTLMWEGQLLATGMQMIDGVAVFTPEMVQAIKQQTDWAMQA